MISFPTGTEMFQFPAFALPVLCIQTGVGPCPCELNPGCPIRRSPDQSLFGGSSELIAAYNVLHRLRTPRHPPYALTSLTTFMKSCDQAAPISTERERSPADYAEGFRRRPELRARLDTSTPTYELVKQRRRPRPPTRLRGPGGTQHVPPGSRPRLSPHHFPTRSAWSRPGSNRQPLPCKGSALPIELRPLGLLAGPGHA